MTLAPVSYLYSLYDALVSIAVPSDKARAVVDAMEHDMGTTLATKPDLENLRQATKQDLALLATREDLLATKESLELLRRDMTSAHRELKQDMVVMRQGIIIQLGSMMVVCFGLALAIVRLWA